MSQSFGSGRFRSTSAINEQVATDVNALVQIVDKNNADSIVSALSDSVILSRLRHSLVDQSNIGHAKDTFRSISGFQTLLAILRLVCDFLKDRDIPAPPPEPILNFVKEVFWVLVEALRHNGNRRYFAKRVDGGGWPALENTLKKLVEAWECGEEEKLQLYGCLLAASLGDEAFSDVFSFLNNGTPTQEVAPALPSLNQRVTSRLHFGEALENPEIARLIVSLWLDSTEETRARPHHKDVLSTVIYMTTSSKRNLVSFHSTGALSLILPYLFDTGRSDHERSLLKGLALVLCEEGLNNLTDAHWLFNTAASSIDASKFLLGSLRRSKMPPSVQFDLTQHGYASIELPALGSPFPPSSGYTVAFWLKVDAFDNEAHTTLFGAFDASQTCFLLIYLERETQYLILQTSIKSPRPSVRFKSVKFEKNRWYHVCLVHKKPRAMGSPRASLFIDGEFVEQLKAQYPASPPTSQSQKESRVQTFLGTPQDLASRVGKNLSASKWSLASANLLEGVVSDDLIAVWYNLGPRYHGNYQDCLGSFLSYKSSAALNLRNESLHPGKEDQSDIVAAIRQKAGRLFPENRTLFSVSPAAIMDNDDTNNINETQLIKSLSKDAAKNLQIFTRSGGNPVAINGAVPAINDALTQLHGIGVLTGDPVVSVPQSLDDASWRIGGCTSVGLYLLDAARTKESVIMAVEIIFETVRDNWRNSEAMERENGYGILAALIRDKLGFSSGGSLKLSSVIDGEASDRDELAMQLLRLILEFTGYNSENPTVSIINNPLAYRVLLVDLDVWRSAALPVQRAYYEQFTLFGAESNYHRFNSKRLARMRIAKKLVDAMKGEMFSVDVLPSFVRAFKNLILGSISAEVLRSLALFVTYAVHHDGDFQRNKSRKSQGSNGNKSLQTNHEPSEGFLSKSQLGVEVLKMFCDMLCDEDTALIKKFARTVTNKWLLYLMSEDDSEVVVLAAKILARLLFIHGTSYVKKFAEKTHGFTIMRHQLKRWWHVPSLWPICLSILFGYDVAKLDFDRNFDLFGFLDLFANQLEVSVSCPEVLTVVAGMIQAGLKTVNGKPSKSNLLQAPSHTRNRSMSLTKSPNRSTEQNPEHDAATLNTVLRFLADIHARSQKFRDFAISSIYVQELLVVLYPVVVGSEIVSAELELNSRDSLKLTANGEIPDHTSPTVIKTATVNPQSPDRSSSTLRRGSSFILVTSNKTEHAPSPARLHHLVVPKSSNFSFNISSSVVQSVLEIVIAVFQDQIFTRKDFSGLGLYLKVPAGFLEHQTYFESWLLRNILTSLGNTLMLNQNLLQEPRVLTNLAKFVTHVGEAIYEGWFIGGAEALLDFAGVVLEHLQRDDIARLKSIRLCSQAIAIIRNTLFRTMLLRLSEVNAEEAESFLQKLTFWQTVLLSSPTSDDQQSDHLQLVCYLLYARLVSEQPQVRMLSADLWRIVLVQKPEEMESILSHAKTSQHRSLSSGFQKIVELDNETFLYWIDDHRDQLDEFFFGAMSKSWESFVRDENTHTELTATERLARRKERLQQWHSEEGSNEDSIRRHEVSYGHWASNIYTSEHLKHQRALQDQSDAASFISSSFNKMKINLRRPNGLLNGTLEKWRLDQTEGRNRMRLRIIPDNDERRDDYQPKRRGAETPLKLDTRMRALTTSEAVGVTPSANAPNESDLPPAPLQKEPAELDDSFEMIEEPADEESYEDKNRKVMRSLHRGDQVQHVANISRIVGLEACEGLLILGKDSLYLLDNFFQRTDGEIINVWQAPKEERDSYVRMISGREFDEKRTTLSADVETRSWKWEDIISVSKRRFLFRDVALEIFFTDGRSYLLTVLNPALRNELYAQILARAPQVSGGPNLAQPEDIWRFETLKSSDDLPQSFGSKFVNVFNQSSTNPATRKWLKGEISNFHYLMLVNTMAGRTFNDLTQYPVFPWVLADYTSEELDLTKPETFRDLSKPMGCQTPEREADYRERYHTLAEMSDENSPAFHYGTHYSSAMIVTSYLIRLQPFVQAYLLLQGGSFDHPDRLFYSIPQTWESASRKTRTDVRELTPEFFYLPEFLVNSNKFNFGVRQSSEKTIDNVELPPWAKGDPRIFIAKHREALESPYVSKNLHRWIDLVFGYKQKGDAAYEAVNVFHHLSYQGAKDLDSIDDPVERLATIGIIHNFGQTPYQVFQRAHPQREEVGHKYKRLDTAVESLARIPVVLLESGERVASLTFSWKQERLLCSAAFRLNIPPIYDKYMEWGFADGSVRFYSTDSRKLIGHFEHLHIGQLSCGIFANSRTLITSGTDCTVSVWSIVSSAKSIDLQPTVCLFGHRAPVMVLALSRSFSILLSASEDGRVFLWDLNRLEFVRELDAGLPVDCARINDVTGNVMLCRGNRVSLYTLNGALLLDQAVCDGTDDRIISCAFYEGASNEWLERDLVFTGHRRGVVKIWNKIVRGDAIKLDLVRQLNHVESNHEARVNIQAGISYILPMPQVVYTGDEEGRVYEWDCVQRH